MLVCGVDLQEGVSGHLQGAELGMLGVLTDSGAWEDQAQPVFAGQQ